MESLNSEEDIKMFTKLQEFLGVKKKPKYRAKNFTKSRINRNGHREVYDSNSDQWLLWIMIMDDTDYIVDFNSFEEVAYDGVESSTNEGIQLGIDGGVSVTVNKQTEDAVRESASNNTETSFETKLNDFVETHAESYTPSSYSPSSSSSSWGDSSSSSSYDSGSSSSGGWD